MKTKILTMLFVIISLMSISQNTCPRVKIYEFPKSDLPPANFKYENYKDITSEYYYYGLGVPKDYIIARYLAFKEMMDSATEPTLGGSTVLLMLYANGYGVKRDIGLCIKLACGNIWSAPAELEIRTQHLEDMQTGKDTGVFDICDDITSGLMEGFCESIYTDKREFEREAIVDSLLKSWSTRDTLAFRDLRKAASDFFDTRVNNEVDLSGTGRAAFELAESDSLEDNFVDKILKSGKCKFQNYSSDDFTKADSELNLMYSKVMNQQNFHEGTITKEGIKTTERSWIPYRDAWVTFMKIKCPQLSEFALKTLLTKERTSQLKDFLWQ